MEDYLDHLYPVIPVVHRPSFRHSLHQNRDLHDKQFLGLLLALCATTVGILPSKFEEYRSAPVRIKFQTRTEMIDCCYAISIQLRGPRYFDEISYSKWAASYLLALAFFQIGELNRARMIEVESMQFARLLELHRISAYSGLNCIETQMRKKAFWLMFYGYVHSQLQSLRKEKLTFLDCSMMQSIDLDKLLPATQDDEDITESSYGNANPARTSLTLGFIIHSRLFWAALRSATDHKGQCHCIHSRDSSLSLDHVNLRLRDLKYMVDSAPSQFRQWATTGDDHAADDKLKSQYATLRANIHITHLWLQSILMDQVDALALESISHLSPVSPVSLPALPDPKLSWHGREDVCRQVLHMLYSIPDFNLEANGLHLIYKVRDIAVSLLACPHKDEAHDGDGPATRAKGYLRDFTAKLTRLDRSEMVNSVSLQSWVDTDKSGTSIGFF